MAGAYIGVMKHLLIPTVALSLTLAPVWAEDLVTPDTPTDEGFSLMEEGAKLLLRGLMQEMEPAIDELEGMTDEMGEAMKLLGEEMAPAMAKLLTRIDDLRNYAAPEILPNGDIIIRRKPEAPIYEPDPETGEVEL